VVLAGAVVAGACRAERQAIRVATTSSVDHSGLLQALLPAFRAETSVDVQTLPVGSGRALPLLANGDADLALSHDPAAEAAYLRSHPGAQYFKIMFSEFVIAGPPDDPAQVRGAPSVVEALRRIAASGVPFASRGDDSGTHARERELWARAGATPAGDARLETGQGMAATLRVASERRAYCLTDVAAFASRRHALALDVVVSGGAELLTTYAVVVPPASAAARGAAARRFAEWLATGRGRTLIERFESDGTALFAPWPLDRPRAAPDALPR
jgi:tungstate transport system substrate-binding protein